MEKTNSRAVTKRFFLFLVVFVPLALLSNLKPVKSVHNSYFSRVITPLHNLINPKVHAQFVAEEHSVMRNFGVSIYLFNKSKYGKQLKRKKYRETIGPDVIKFPNLNSLVLIPSLLMLCLFMVTPISITQKLSRAAIGLLILYLILVFFFANSFELYYAGGLSFAIDSVWRFIISLFGFDNQELVNVVVIIIWIGLVAPLIIRRNPQLFVQV